MKNYFNTKKITFLALFTALVTISTITISIPHALGYTNFGDLFIFLAAMFFDPFFAFVAGGVGSMLADLFLGYASYAPFTFVVKGLEGLICGLFVKLLLKAKFNEHLSLIFSMLLGAVVMIVGYIFTNTILLGSFLSSVVGSVNDVIQGTVSTLLAYLITYLLSKIKSLDNYILNPLLYERYNHKSVALFNDLSGFGNCSLVTAISTISSFGHEVHPLPTAVLSNQTDFDFYHMVNLDSDYEKLLLAWKNLNVKFDCAYLGFCSNLSILEKIDDYCNDINVKKIIDPVLGDNGELYKCFDTSFVDYYKNIISTADIITPNFTEACLLTDTPFTTFIDLESMKSSVQNILDKFSQLGVKNVVITGIHCNNKVYVCYYDGINTYYYKTKKLNGNYSGAGDLFASLITGYTLSGYTYKKAVKLSFRKISFAVKYSAKKRLDLKNGIAYWSILKMR